MAWSNLIHKSTIVVPFFLPYYDYSQPGAYFVTIVAWHRQCRFGEIVNHTMKLSPFGEIVQKWWRAIALHFPDVKTGAFVVMPNHVHGIIWIHERRGTVPAPDDKDDLPIMDGSTPPLRTPTLGQIIAYFKYQSTKEMNLLANTGMVAKFWQRNYYEHIIRDDTDLQNKTDYIEANPLLWNEDNENTVLVK